MHSSQNYSSKNLSYDSVLLSFLYFVKTFRFSDIFRGYKNGMGTYLISNNATFILRMYFLTMDYCRNLIEKETYSNIETETEKFNYVIICNISLFLNLVIQFGFISYLLLVSFVSTSQFL